MGLDIAAYGSLERVGDYQDDYQDGCIAIYIEAGREDRAAPLTKGIYRYDPKKVKSFCAGTYFSYNQWRRWLCLTMLDIQPETIWKNPDSWTGYRFVELIDFSDCEGTIGPIVAAKLAKDFAEHREKAAAYVAKQEDGDWILRKYTDFQEAFTLAALEGAVQFH